MSVITSVQSFDNRVLLWSLKHRNRQFVMRTIRLLSTSGDGYAQVGAIGLLALLNHYTTLFSLVVLLAVERTIYWVSKNSLKRPRPQERFPSFQSVIEASDRFSFPSGHTSAAFLLAAVLSQLMIMLNMVWVVPLLFLWAIGVAASRIWLGVHYPSDTLAGAALGLSVAAFGL